MVEVKVCAGMECSFRGGLEILEYLENDSLLQNKIKITVCNCINKQCKPDNAPVVVVGHETLKRATLDVVLLKIGDNLK